jgi:hypothetical protein
MAEIRTSAAGLPLAAGPPQHPDRAMNFQSLFAGLAVPAATNALKALLATAAAGEATLSLGTGSSSAGLLTGMTTADAATQVPSPQAAMPQTAAGMGSPFPFDPLQALPPAIQGAATTTCGVANGPIGVLPAQRTGDPASAGESTTLHARTTPSPSAIPGAKQLAGTHRPNETGEIDTALNGTASAVPVVVTTNPSAETATPPEDEAPATPADQATVSLTDTTSLATPIVVAQPAAMSSNAAPPTHDIAATEIQPLSGERASSLRATEVSPPVENAEIASSDMPV